MIFFFYLELMNYWIKTSDDDYDTMKLLQNKYEKQVFHIEVTER